MGIDAARGVALLGLASIHILPAWVPGTFQPTAQWTVFAGRSAALFALLAGVSLAFSSGGRSPHTGKAMAAARAGIAVRAVLITAIGLSINTVALGALGQAVPAVNILVYYGAFFLLAIPFLAFSPPVLFVIAGVSALVTPVLMQLAREAAPAATTVNSGFGELVAQPGASLVQLLLTGTYPALPYLTYLLVGLALGRLDLADVQVQVLLVVFGVILAVAAWATYWVLILQAGGYDQLMAHSPSLSEDQIDEVIVFGPDPALPTTTWWWLAIPGPHTNTPLALLHGLGASMAVLGGFLLLARRLQGWLLPLSAMGSMTLTLYTTHLLALSTEAHYDQPYLWFALHLLIAAAFALVWQQFLGQGPLERLIARAVSTTRRRVLATQHRTP
ncbi:heparan-alpha-glucosaminide N-acetyltransferase domain-containing protein [Kocuria oceani]|uniref:Heparan-alpha-glucosaminide N-acetyltransferase domain-containing protein n=1 Tax=Kocuria oceani TaxID=988827 RepID=A0ABV9TJQ2_9MICC|nr:heparan-alpha-glucosaminide N-acetyltransferase domain-containing protein [Kocuria oceani]